MHDDCQYDGVYLHIGEVDVVLIVVSVYFVTFVLFRIHHYTS